MFCKYCGQKLEDTATFCSHCGAATKSDPVPPQCVPPVEEPTQHETPSVQYQGPAVQLDPKPSADPAAPVDPNALKNLKSYLQTSIIVGIIGIVLAILGVISLVLIGQIVSCLIIVAFGALLMYTGFGSRKSMDKLINEMTASGEIHAVLQDFSTATSLVNDKIRLGETYVFGKKKDNIVRYTDIRKLYQSIKKRNFVESSRTLDYVGADGNIHTLCDLYLKGKSDEDAAKIMLIVKTKNPNVQLGYK